MADNAASKAFDFAAKNVIDLARVEAGSVSKVKSFLAGLESDLVTILNDNKDISPGKKAKLETILKAAGNAIDTTYQSISKEHGSDLSGIAKAQSSGAVKTVNHAIGVDVFGAVLTESQLAAVASDTAVFGHASGDWWKSQSDQLRFKFAGQMKQGYALGEDVDALVRRVRGTKAAGFKDGIMQVSRREAEALVRSSIQTISNEAALKSYAALGDTIKGIEWLATLDTRTTLTCFEGSTPVAPIGRIRKVFRRSYKGEIVLIRTATGKQLAVTPNHPILTAKGWRLAGEIQPGDQVVDCMAIDSVAVGNDVKMHPTFASLANALFHPSISEVFEESSATTHFHGDGMGRNEKVDIATIKSELGDGFNPFPADSIEHKTLVWLHATGCLTGNGGFSDLVFSGGPLSVSAEFVTAPLQGAVESGFADSGCDNDFRWKSSFAEHGDGKIDISALLVTGDVFQNTSPLQEAGDCSCADAVSFGDITCGLAIVPTFEDVIRVGSEFRSVHVYNVETSQGVYIAGGLLVKNCRALDGKVWTLPDLKPVGHTKVFPGPVAHWNCRSRVIPVLRSWEELAGKPLKALDGKTFEERLKAKLAAKGMSADKIAMAAANARASMDGQASGSPDMETWLKSKPDSFIKGVLGPTRAKMLAEGKITIADLTDQNNRPLTIAQLQAAIDGGGFAVETEGVDFAPFDKAALKTFNDTDAAAAQEAAKKKIAAVLADPKAAGNSILATNLAKIQAAEPSLTPAEVLAKAEEATAAKIAANTKSSILSKAKKKMLAGEEPTPAQKALIDELGDDEKALFMEGVADAKTAAQIKEANAAATAKLTSWSADPVKQKAIDKALAAGASADKPLELAAAADKALADLVAGETSGNTLAAAKKAMKALTGMNAPTPAGVTAWLKQQGKDPAEFLAEFQAVTKEKADQSAKSSVLSKAKKKLAAGEAMTPAQQKLFDDLTPEEQASFTSDVDAMKGKVTAAPAIDVPVATPVVQTSSITTIPNPATMKVIRQLSGSTRPLLMEDENGKQWVVKSPDQGGGGRLHLENEAAADEIYRLAGAAVPNSKFVEWEGKPYKVAEYLDGAKTLGDWERTATAAEKKAIHAKISENFVIDAVMGNWDVLGQSNDNVMVLPDGTPVRVDNGGALDFRAQGARKTAKEWNGTVNELKTLRDPSTAAGQTAKVFSGLTDADINIQIANLVGKRDELVEAVKRLKGDDVAKVFSDRIDFLKAQLPADLVPASKQVAEARQNTFDAVPKDITAKVLTARVNGHAVAIGSSHVEDMQGLTWQEKAKDGSAVTVTHLKLTDAGSQAVMDAIGTELGKVAVTPVSATPIMTGPQKSGPVADDLTPKWVAMAKTLNTHKADGGFNAGTVQTFETELAGAKTKLSDLQAKKEKTAAEKAEIDQLKYTIAIGDQLAVTHAELKAAITSGKPSSQAIPYVSKQEHLVEDYQDDPGIAAAQAKAAAAEKAKKDAEAARIAALPKPVFVVKKSSEYQIRTNTFKNGYATNNATQKFSVQNGVYDLTFHDGTAVTFVPRSGRFGSQSSAAGLALEGIVQVRIPADADHNAVMKTMETLQKMGIDTTAASDDYREMTWLRKTVYVNNNHTLAGWKTIEAMDNGPEQVKAARQFIEKKYGVKVPERGTAGYTADGVANSFGDGFKHVYRADLTRADAESKMAGYVLMHKSYGADIVDALDGMLTSGGEATPTTGRFRKGVPIAGAGMSASADITTGGADFFFTRLRAKGSVEGSSINFKIGNIARADAVTYTGDLYGATGNRSSRRTSVDDFKKIAANRSNDETILKNGLFLLDEIDIIKASSASQRQRFLDVFAKHGVTHLTDGRKIEDIVTL